MLTRKMGRMQWHHQNFAKRDFWNFFHASVSKLKGLLAFLGVNLKMLLKIDISPWRRIRFEGDTAMLFRKMGRMR